MATNKKILIKSYFKYE